MIFFDLHIETTLSLQGRYDHKFSYIVYRLSRCFVSLKVHFCPYALVFSPKAVESEFQQRDGCAREKENLNNKELYEESDLKGRFGDVLEPEILH